ncbi:hypothetical protein [Ideonella sp.]|uniref:hypothetical protein n=1 Tax=Ideonella sp. TaxID=1929293 RepID=UPI00351B4048
MKFQTEITVVGMKASKGTLDNGQAYDSTKVYALVDMDTTKGLMVGQSAAEYTLGVSTEFEKYKSLPYPFKGVADMEIITSGSKTRTVMTGLRPVEGKKA